MFLPFTSGKRLQQVQETTATDYLPHVTRRGLNREGATATGYKGAAATRCERIVVMGVRSKATELGRGQTSSIPAEPPLLRSYEYPEGAQPSVMVSLTTQLLDCF